MRSFKAGVKYVYKSNDGPKRKSVINRCDPFAGFTDLFRLVEQVQSNCSDVVMGQRV